MAHLILDQIPGHHMLLLGVPLCYASQLQAEDVCAGVSVQLPSASKEPVHGQRQSLEIAV